MLQGKWYCHTDIMLLRSKRVKDSTRSIGSPFTLLLPPVTVNISKAMVGIDRYEYEIPTLCKIQSWYLDLLKQDDSVSLVIDSSSRSRSNGGCSCKMKLHQAGEEAYLAYLSAYARLEYKDIYDKNNLDVKKVTLCFSFDKPPLKYKSQSSSILHSQETTASLWMSMKNNKKDDTGCSWMKWEEKSWGYAAINVKKK